MTKLTVILLLLTVGCTTNPPAPAQPHAKYSLSQLEGGGSFQLLNVETGELWTSGAPREGWQQLQPPVPTGRP